MADRKGHAVGLWNPFLESDPFGRWLLQEAARPARSVPTGFAPAADLLETSDLYTVVVELPGTKKRDVTVEIHNGRLTIRGEKRDERVEKGEYRRHAERRFGAFCRSFSLPVNADGGRIEAHFEDGVLTVEIPKTKEAEPQNIPIKG